MSGQKQRMKLESRYYPSDRLQKKSDQHCQLWKKRMKLSQDSGLEVKEGSSGAVSGRPEKRRMLKQPTDIH